MPKLPRTFARVRSFDLACPACGTLSVVVARATRTQRHRRTHGQEKAEEWDPNTGIWKCRGCLGTYSVGLVLWRAAGHGARQAPGDRVPTPAESLGLRAIVAPEPAGTGGRARGNVVSERAVGEDPELPRRETIREEPWADVDDEEGRSH